MAHRAHLWPRIGSSGARATLALLVALVASPRAHGEILAFDATFSLRQFGVYAHMTRPGPSWSGSGVGVSSSAPSSVDFLQFTHSTGSRLSSFMGLQGTGGFPVTSSLWATLDDIGDPSFGGMPLGGFMLVRGFLASQLPLANPSGTLGLGVGGTLPFTFINPTAGTPITGAMLFAPWFTGMSTISGLLSKFRLSFGFIRPTPSFTITSTGFDARTPGGLGSVQFISPVQIVASGVGTNAGFGVLRIDFVPEPTRFVTLGAGVAVLLLLGMRRRGRALLKRAG